jgi:hypothetical protein
LIYTSWENVCKFHPDVCGTYIRLNTAADVKAIAVGVDLVLKISLKIVLQNSLDRFLILKNL